MKKYLSLILTALLVLSLFTACGGASKSYDAAAPMEYAVEAPAAEKKEANSMLTDSGTGGSTAIPENRKWIITVDMRAETEDLDAMLAALDQKISALNGYVEGQNVYNGSSYSSGSRYRTAYLTIRIPAEDVDSFTEAVSGISNIVRSNKNLEDITLTYVSTESRMKALQTEEERLLELMEQAQTMADLLEIEARLTDVRYELESVTSRLRTYDNQVNYATIHLDIEEVQEYTPVAERTVWQRISEGFVSSLKNLGESLVDLLVWVLVNSPYLVLYAAVITAVVILVRKSKKRKALKKAPKAPEEKKED